MGDIPKDISINVLATILSLQTSFFEKKGRERGRKVRKIDITNSKRKRERGREGE